MVLHATLAPRLRHRIDLQAPAVAVDSDSDGSVAETWASVLGVHAGRLPAEIIALSGREFVAASAVQAGVTHRITIRWWPGVAARMRVVHEGAVFDIKAVLPDPKLRRWLTLMCEQGVNNG